MSDATDTLEYRGYKIELHSDDSGDTPNPFKEDEGAPTLVLHAKAENHFGWSNNKDWQHKLSAALDRLNDRMTKDTALGLIQRWLRVFHGVPVVLPVSAGEHSGTWTYLGSSAHWIDPGGWDSGWVGWLFFTREQIEEFGFTDWDDERIENSLEGSFTEFAAWVENDVYGIKVIDPDGEELDSCWGYLNSERWRKDDGDVRQEWTGYVDDEIARREKAAAELEAHAFNDHIALYRRAVNAR